MNKEKIATEAHKTIDNWIEKANDLEQKKDELDKSARDQFNKKLTELDKKKEELQNKYKELKNASDENLNEMMKAYNASLDHFKKGIREIELILS